MNASWARPAAAAATLLFKYICCRRANIIYTNANAQIHFTAPTQIVFDMGARIFKCIYFNQIFVSYFVDKLLINLIE